MFSDFSNHFPTINDWRTSPHKINHNYKKIVSKVRELMMSEKIC